MDKEIISEPVRQIVQSIKKNLQVNWYYKRDAKAQMMLSVKKILRGKRTLEKLNVVMDEIMEQATERYKEWSVVVA